MRFTQEFIGMYHLTHVSRWPCTESIVAIIIFSSFIVKLFLYSSPSPGNKVWGRGESTGITLFCFNSHLMCLLHNLFYGELQLLSQGSQLCSAFCGALAGLIAFDSARRFLFYGDVMWSCMISCQNFKFAVFWTSLFKSMPFFVHKCCVRGKMTVSGFQRSDG